MNRFCSGFMKPSEGGPNKVGVNVPNGELDYDLRNYSPLADDEAIEGTSNGDLAV